MGLFFSFSGSCIAQWEEFQQGFLHDEFSAFFGSAELRLIFFLWSLVQGVFISQFFHSLLRGFLSQFFTLYSVLRVDFTFSSLL
jgi:hypothetical protein